MIRSIPRIELLFAPGCAAIQGTIAIKNRVAVCAGLRRNSRNHSHGR